MREIYGRRLCFVQVVNSPDKAVGPLNARHFRSIMLWKLPFDWGDETQCFAKWHYYSIVAIYLLNCYDVLFQYG